MKELLSTRFPDELQTWYRSPSKFVEELQKITSALQEEGITVGIAPKTALVTLTTKGEERWMWSPSSFLFSQELLGFAIRKGTTSGGHGMGREE
ncbi:hypothetical protein [Ktedonospora formicarum]|uniref:Uncharacterized protein n=1 Tax=Ktedonospora formicarum TaxID=2778364 RepID=A0A8J3IC62_9CHLR|nr:hypothetical protein [Ktedonospora formicarum]GHO48684.1 hypothetical protein KSX_68470 [Ktedonospora formicarum]